MKNAAFICALTFILSACATSMGGGPNDGRFVMAGPTNTDATVASMRWQYGLQLSISPSAITEISFDCSPIPGTTFVTKGENLRVLRNGSIFADGPALAVSKESTPWLFDNSTTTATCSAKITSGERTKTLEAPVSFPGMTKIATVVQIEEAHKYNSRLKQK